jgi:hypothetical protein
LKEEIKLSPEERLLTAIALFMHRDNVEEGEKPIYKMVFSKVDKGGSVILMDGMEMKCATAALRFMSTKFESSFVTKLADWFESKRVSFQQSFWNSKMKGVKS